MILVTGGAGFIGSVLVKELNKIGRTDIIIIDRLRDTLKWKNLRGLKFDRFIHAEDIFEADLDDLDGIFHMGACSATTELDMDFLFDNNVEYSQMLFDVATNLNIPFIYASSAATYGDGELGYSDDHAKIDSYIPLNRYGYSKSFFDQWVLRQEEKPELWFGLKFFNVYGPNEYHKGSMRSMVNKSYEQILEFEGVKLFKSHKDGFEDGEQLRDFVYGVDVARAMVKMFTEGTPDKSAIYNMGTGTARSFKDLSLACFKAMGMEPKIEYVPMPKELRGQYQYYTKADMTKFNEAFPGFTFMNLEEGVTDYVTNYLKSSNQHL